MPKFSTSLLALLLAAAGIASAQPDPTAPDKASDQRENARETATERRPGAVDTTGPGGMVGSEEAVQAPSSGTSGNSQDCAPAKQNQRSGATQADSECAEAGASGSSATRTDSQPIGSATKADGPTSESEYPVSPGTGSMGSGSTGSPAGPSSGPTLGIGR